MGKNSSFSPNIRKVPPENFCDICKRNKAPFYSVLYYIHVCSPTCYRKFVEKFNKEVSQIAISRQSIFKEDKSNENSR